MLYKKLDETCENFDSFLEFLFCLLLGFFYLAVLLINKQHFMLEYGKCLMLFAAKLNEITVYYSNKWLDHLEHFESAHTQYKKIRPLDSSFPLLVSTVSCVVRSTKLGWKFSEKMFSTFCSFFVLYSYVSCHASFSSSILQIICCHFRDCLHSESWFFLLLPPASTHNSLECSVSTMKPSPRLLQIFVCFTPWLSLGVYSF